MVLVELVAEAEVGEIGDHDGRHGLQAGRLGYNGVADHPVAAVGGDRRPAPPMTTPGGRSSDELQLAPPTEQAVHDLRRHLTTAVTHAADVAGPNASQPRHPRRASATAPATVVGRPW